MRASYKPDTFRLNLVRAGRAVAEQVTDLALQRAILQALEERTFTVTGASQIEIVDKLVVP
jgi:hypothetical protein